MSQQGFQRYLFLLRLLLSCILVSSIAFYVYKSLRWEVMWDTSIMHYVNFLMSKGFAPYRDIVDINLPACYFLEGWAMRIFGGGDLGWRLFDYSLLSTVTLSMIVIARPYDWFAGLYAGVMFALIHGAWGPILAAERDEQMTVLIVVGYALLFTSLRRLRPSFLLPCGFAFGLAVSIKPTIAPLVIFLFPLLLSALRRRSIAVGRYILYGIAGFLLATSLSLIFLYKYHVFGDMISVASRLVQYYSKTGNRSYATIYTTLFQSRNLLIIGVGLVLTFVSRAERSFENWERTALIVGISLAAFSVFAQHKGYPYHGYPFIALLLLWSTIEFCKALGKRGWMHFVGLACLLIGVCYHMPNLDKRIATMSPRSEEPDALRSDLANLGAVDKQKRVQCFDMVEACYITLYRLDILPYSTLVGDYMLFGTRTVNPEPYYQSTLWRQLQTRPPDIIVLTNQWLGEEDSFDKINQWPELRNFIEMRYLLRTERAFDKQAYRLYVLKSGPA